MDTNRLTRGIVGAAAAGALVLTAACGGSGAEETSALQRAIDAGTITVGFAGEAPYSFEQNGELTGATVALHREIFSALGVEDLDGVNTEFGSLIPGLAANRFDVVSAGMSILPERCEQAAFSNPEFMYTTALMVEAGNPHGLSTLDDLVGQDDLSVVTMTGAIESDYARSLGLANATEVGTPQDGMDAVTSGRADAFALTGISLNWMADNSDAAVEVTESFVQEIDGVPQVGAGGTVFRTEDTELLEAYNTELDRIISDEARYLEIVGEFGFTAEERPDGSITTDQLCAGDLPTGES